MKKLFISHASEDKDDFVRPLAEALSKEFDVWYDEYSLIVGISLLRQINEGLIDSDYGIVVLSPMFFSKKWPQDELDGLYALEEKNRKVILPIWKDIEFEQVKKYSPILAGRYAAKAKDGIEKVVNEIKQAIMYFERGRSVEARNEGLNKLRAILQKDNERKRSEKILRSIEGVHKSYEIASRTIKILANHAKSLNTQGGYKGLRIEDPVYDSYTCSVFIFIGRKYLHAEYYNNVGNSAFDARLSVRIGEVENKNYSAWYENEFAVYIDLDDKPFWKTDDGNNLQSPEDVVDHLFGKFAEMLESE